MAATYKVLGQAVSTSATLTITNYIGNATTTVTGTVASTAGYTIGDIITITLASGTEQTKLNGIWTIASIPTGSTFTFVVNTAVASGTLTTGLGSTTRSGLVNLYTVPSSTSTVCSTLVICNQSVSTNFRVAVRPAGATLAVQHYIIFDNFVNQYDSVFLTLGISLATTDIITVVAGTSNISFSLFGSEIV